MVSVADPRRVSYLPQPGIPVEDTTAVAAQGARALSGLGPLSVTRRQVTTEIQVRRKQAGRRPGRRPVTAGRDRPR